jgi:hypothetical protein
MDAPPWFYRSDDDWRAIVERLKLTPCPHCKAVGSLIRHGVLYGFDDSRPQRQTLRARRIFCSNRNARPGCGRTVSVWHADKIRRLCLSAATLWRFLLAAASIGIVAAMRDATAQLSYRTCQRLWQRFVLRQSNLRTALCGCCPPPQLPAPPSRRPLAAQTLAHLQAAFPNSDSPIAAFQQTLHTFFV